VEQLWGVVSAAISHPLRQILFHWAQEGLLDFEDPDVRDVVALHAVLTPFIQRLLDDLVLSHNTSVEKAHAVGGTRDDRFGRELAIAVEKSLVDVATEEQVDQAEREVLKWAAEESACAVRGVEEAGFGPWEDEAVARSSLTYEYIAKLYGRYSRPERVASTYAEAREVYVKVREKVRARAEPMAAVSEAEAAAMRQRRNDANA
jgi:hypothetical protein